MSRLHRAGATALAVTRIGNPGQKGRFAYLVTTVAVTVAGWLTLAAMASPFIEVDATLSGSGVSVRNARSSQQMLPARYADRLGALPGVRDVVYRDMQLVICGSGSTVTVNAIGGTGAMREALDGGFDAMAVQEWKADPTGILVTREAADACDWSNGATIQPPDAIGQSRIPLRIYGIADQAEGKGSFALAHYDYINGHYPLLAGKGEAMSFTVSALDPRQNEALVSNIEREFAADDPPLLAYPDTARESARSRFGKVQNLLAMVMAALFVCCALVLASVMAHAATERRPRLGMLLVLGFRRRFLVAGLLIEGLALILAGGATGLLAGTLVLRFLPGWLGGMFGNVTPAAWAYWLIPGWLLALLAVAMVQPCLVALRTRPVDCNGG